VGIAGSGGVGVAGSGGVREITHETANSVTRPPTNLTATEKPSPRYIDLTWKQPTFGQIVKYNIYRSSDNGATFSKTPYDSVIGTPPATNYTDQNATCNPTGYRYEVTAVVISDITKQEQESVASNIAPSSTPPLLTGCYTNTQGAVVLTGFVSPAANSTFTQGDTVTVAWQLLDDDTGTVVSRAAANTLLAVGPIPSPYHDNSCPQLVSVPVVLNYPGNYPYPVTTLSASGSGITFGAYAPNDFAFSWNTRTGYLGTGAAFNAGCYVLELDLDSGQPLQAGLQPPQGDRAGLQLLIYVSDTGPYVTTTTLPDADVGAAYSNTLFEAGGVSPFTWTIDPSSPGPLPPGLSLDNSGKISGKPTTAGLFNFTVRVTDNNLNYGTRALTLRVVDLNGTYAFLLRGFDPSGNALAIGGSFTATGGGNITGGVMDINDVSTGISSALTINPSLASFYSLRGDHRGQLTLNTSAGSQTFDFAMGSISSVSGAASLGHIISTQTSPPNGSAISGVFKQQDTTVFSLAAVTGDFAFGFEGADNSNARSAGAGRLTVNSVGSLANGVLDFNDNGSVTSGTTFTGVVDNNAVNSTTGRGTMTLNLSSGSALHQAFYVVSANELFTVSTDPIDSVAQIKNIAITNTVLTVTAANNFAAGQVVLLNGLTGAAGLFLNGQEVIITTVSSTQFTAIVPADNYASTPDTGTATTIGTLYAGSALRQSTSFCATTGSCTFNNGALNGNSVVYIQSNSAGGSRVQVGALTFTPTNNSNTGGSISGGFDQNDGGVITANTTNTVSGTYTVASNGQVTIPNMTIGNAAAPAPVLYLVNTNQAFLVGTNTVVEFGVAETQVGPIAFATGGRATGSEAPAVSGTQVFDQVAIVTATSNTTANETNDTVDINSIAGGLLEKVALPNFVLNNLDQTSGRFTFSNGSSGTSPRVGYFVNSTRRIVINADPNVTMPYIIFSDNQ